MNILKAQYGLITNDIMTLKLPDQVKKSHLNKLESLLNDVNINAEASNTIIKWQRRLYAIRDGN